MNGISIILVIVVAFLAGMEGILDEFQFHQPLVACTLIGLVTGQLVPCIILGGTLQMIALGWANIGDRVNLLSVEKGWRTPRYNDLPICFPYSTLSVYFLQPKKFRNTPYLLVCILSAGLRLSRTKPSVLLPP